MPNASATVESLDCLTFSVNHVLKFSLCPAQYILAMSKTALAIMHPHFGPFCATIQKFTLWFSIVM